MEKSPDQIENHAAQSLVIQDELKTYSELIRSLRTLGSLPPTEPISADLEVHSISHDAATAIERLAAGAARGRSWMGMANAPRVGPILLCLGTTIPDLVDARVGTYHAGDDCDELGWTEYAKYGAWMIWNDAGDWFLVDVFSPLGWLPLPDAIPEPHIVDLPARRAFLSTLTGAA